MTRNTMTKARAEQLARKMVKRNVSAFAGRYTVAIMFNANKLMTVAATQKVLQAFRKAALKSPKYTPFEKMCIEDKLEENS